MKKLLFLLLILLTGIGFSSAVYMNVSDRTIYYDGTFVSTGTTITTDYFIYDSNFELQDYTIDVVLYSGSVSGLDVATFTYNFAALDTYKVDLVSTEECRLYFNATDSTPLIFSGDFTQNINTKYVYRILIDSDATESVDINIYKDLGE